MIDWLIDWLLFLMIYDDEAGIAHESASTYCGPFIISGCSICITLTPSQITGEHYYKMEPKFPKGGHCQSIVRPQGVFNVPILQLIQWRRQRQLTVSATHDVVSRKISPW